MIIKAAQKSLTSNLATGLAFEAQCFASLIHDKVTRNLIFLNKHQQDFVREKSQRVKLNEKPHLRHGFIIGAGIVGGTLAGIAAASGLPVRLKDIEPQKIALGLKTARAFLDYKVRAGELQPEELYERMNLISTTIDYSGIRRADFVIEALPEDLAVKKDVLATINPLLKTETFVYTTTSILSYHSLSIASGRSDKFMGLHFIPPIDRNPLVEVIKDLKTNPEAVDTTLYLMERLQKTPFVVKDSPGYLINRILAPYLIEAVLLLEEGVSADEIERIMQDFGMESGPFRILDEIGIHNALAIGQILFFQFGERFRLPRSLKIILQEKRFGKAARSGFYQYTSDGQALHIDPKINKLIKSYNPFFKKLSTHQIQQRMVFILLNEAARCVAEKIVTPIKHIDLAMVFAKLFPAFHGGPLRYIDTCNVQNLVKEMDSMAGQFGERFEPTSILTEYSTRNGKFYQPY